MSGVGVLALVVAAISGRGQSAPQQPPTAEAPYHDFRLQTLDYVGPIEEDPDPSSLTEVTIGWFGPSDSHHPLHGDLWTAAALAVEEINQEGGLQGLPVRLVPRWSENPWGSGVAQVARLVHEEHIRALVGAVDSPGTHLAEQVAVKARIVLVSPVSTDESANLAGVPWMFSVVPGDHLWAPLLVRRLLESIGNAGFALLTTTDHDSRLAAREVLGELTLLDRGPSLRIDLQPSARDLESSLQRLFEAPPPAVLLVASAAASADVVRALRQGGFSGPIFAGPQSGRRAFLESAGQAADGVILPCLFDAESGGAEVARFVRRFEERSGFLPDWAAAHTYDATRLLLDAIRQAGMNRAAIRHGLLELTPWQGVTGIIEWDATGQNRRPANRLATIRGGAIVPD